MTDAAHTPTHTPVLLAETLALLQPRPGEVFLDCTAGLGGHAAAIAERLQPGGTVVLNDADPGNLDRATQAVMRVAPGLKVLALQGNFAEVPHKLGAAGLKADLVLADLGFASNQVEAGERGFSFSREGPLDMRLDPSMPTSAADLVASLSEAELADLIERFGDERNARRIARKLVQTRSSGPILTTTRLAEVVRSASPGRRGPGQIDPATRTFQALRIAVNDEIGSLEALLGSLAADARLISNGSPGRWLSAGARIAIITFHSLEDRPVKQAFAGLIGLGFEDLSLGHVTAGEAELAANTRARSAKLRCIGMGLAGKPADG